MEYLRYKLRDTASTGTKCCSHNALQRQMREGECDGLPLAAFGGLGQLQRRGAARPQQGRARGRQAYSLLWLLEHTLHEHAHGMAWRTEPREAAGHATKAEAVALPSLKQLCSVASYLQQARINNS